MLDKIKKPFLILLFLSVWGPLSIFAQSYGTALGVRVSDGFGFTLQQQVTVHTTAEVILQSGFQKKDVTLTVLGELHNSLLTRGFNFYLGGGVYHRWLEKNTNLIEQPTNPWGISPIMGLELTMGKLNFLPTLNPISVWVARVAMFLNGAQVFLSVINWRVAISKMIVGSFGKIGLKNNILISIHELRRIIRMTRIFL
jgi:hypothetical protein